jgi:transposase
MIKALLNSIKIKRPPKCWGVQHLLLDKGYDADDVRDHANHRGYVEHIPYRKNRTAPKKKRLGGRRKARRWVVERLGSWLNKFRRLKIRYERKDENYQALISFACAVIIFRSLR